MSEPYTHPDWIDDTPDERQREILDEYDQHLEAVYQDELDRLRDHGE